MDKLEFGRRLRDERKRVGLTQADVAKLCDVTAGAVSGWERGASYPDLDHFSSIVRTYLLNVRYLLCLTDENEAATEDEQRLLRIYRTSDETQKRYIVDTAMDILLHGSN